MKKTVLTFLSLYTFVFLLQAQVAINNSSLPANNSAALDISSNNKGVLIPRMTSAERQSIVDPARGLMVTEINTGKLWYFNGEAWRNISIVDNNTWSVSGDKIYTTSRSVGIGTAYPSYPINFEDEAMGNKISLFGNSSNHFGIGVQPGLMQFYVPASSDNIVFGYGHSNALNEKMRIKGDGRIGIGTPVPHESAILDMNSSDRGFLIPKMTKDAREAITSPARGLIIYQTNNGPGLYVNKGEEASPSWFHAGVSQPSVPQGYTEHGISTISTLNSFISRTVEITIVSESQRIFVSAHAALGSTTGANDLNLFPGYRLSTQTSDPPTQVGGGLLGLSVSANQRNIFSISGYITNLAPGIYSVGVIGQSSVAASWNNNDFTYVTAVVF